MKTLKIALIALFTAFTAQAQTADEIISNYFETIGGKEKLNALEGIQMEMVAKYGGLDIPVNLVSLKGGKMYVVINLQGKEIKQMATDGNEMWTTNMMTQKAEKVDSEANENAKLSNQDFPDPLLNYAQKGYSVEYLGKEVKEGTDCFKIKLTKKPVKVAGVETPDEIFYYFETENYLPILTETEIKQGPMKGQKSVSKMSDYQEVDGIYFPFSMNQFGSDMEVKKITLNPVVEESAFKFPAE